MSEKSKSKIDWLLFIFLLLFTNQAILSVKIIGLILICFARFNWQFGFFKGRMPQFYIYILLLAVFNFLFITKEFTTEYTVAFIVGNLFWVFSAIGTHHVKLSVERYGPESVYNAMKIFIIINFISCIAQLVNIMMITGYVNPYNDALKFPYGMSTGDNIFGAFMQNSYYNTMVSGMLAIYFMYKRSFFYALLAVSCLVLVFGNFGTIVFISIIAALLLTGIFAALTRDMRGKFLAWVRQVAPPGKYYFYLPGVALFIFAIYFFASPKNLDYIVDKARDKIFRVKSSDKNNYATLIDNQKLNPLAFDPFSDYFKRIEDSLIGQSNVASLSPTASVSGDKLDAKIKLTRSYIVTLQGKNLSVLETIAYLKSSSTAFLFGAGTTRFSSLIAQKMSGYDSSRIFMTILPPYKSKLYAENHYLLIDGREKSEDEAHLSTANWPDSLYNQLFGEYGVIGAVLFLVFYLGFFAKKIRYWSYGFWVVAVLLPFAHLNYVFDTLCVMPFFELLMFADIAENSKKELDG